MPPAADIARYLENLKTEREAVTLYEKLAAAEPNPDLSHVYLKMAATERRHVEAWEGKLIAAGVSVPSFRPSWRTRTLGWLAARLGPGAVLPTLAAIEKGAGSEYADQPGDEVAIMSAQERSHARIFGYLARTNRGMEGSTVARFEGRHRGAGGNALRAGVLGANDGLVSVFSLVMGVAGAGVGSRGIILTGIAGLLAGALSMALGEWLSVQSSRELYANQLEIEKRELDQIPEEETEELALIYQAKGIAPETARAMAQRLLTDPDTALDTLAREELAIDPAELGGSAWEAAITSFFLFSIGALVPLLPYFFFTGAAGVIASAISSAIGLFLIGAAITLMTGRGVLFSGLRQVGFGLATAAVTFGVGRLIGVNVAG
jgi:VIT1/CCC1 family predicted Fe2+/Mn2+ transporter